MHILANGLTVAAKVSKDSFSYGFARTIVGAGLIAIVFGGIWAVSKILGKFGGKNNGS